MNLPSGWKLIHGLPVKGEGDVCVVAFTLDSEKILPVINVIESGIHQSDETTFPDDCVPFSPEHFAAADKLLSDYLRQKREEDIEVVESNNVTMIRRKSDGEEAIVVPAINDRWMWRTFKRDSYYSANMSRESAESAAKNALMGE